MGDPGTLVLVLALVALAAVAAFALAAVVFGRADLTPPRRASDHFRLPSGPLTAEDVAELRFRTALRGYRMSEVDQVLARVQEQLPVRREAAAAPGQDGSGEAQPPVT